MEGHVAGGIHSCSLLFPSLPLPFPLIIPSTVGEELQPLEVESVVGGGYIWKEKEICSLSYPLFYKE